MNCYTGMKMLYPLSGISDDLDLQFEVEGAVFDRILQDIAKLLPEIFPDSANCAVNSEVGLLELWEDLFGIIPVPGSDTVSRRLVLLGRMQLQGGINKEFFYRLAGQFGYSRYAVPYINIVDGEFPPFQLDDPVHGLIGISPLNDNVLGGSAFTWSVYGTGITSASALQDAFKNLRPAWTEVVFEDV